MEAPKYQVVRTQAQAEMMMLAIGSSVYLSLDVETNGLPWYHRDFQVLCLAVASPLGSTFVLPLNHLENLNLSRSMELLNYIFQNFPARGGAKFWTMQNGAFDYLAMRQLGIDLGQPWFDTLGVQYLLDVDAPKGLETLAQRWLKMPPWKDTVNYKKIAEEPLDVLMELCARDARVTCDLRAPMEEALKAKPNLAHLFDVLLLPAMVALADMEWEGVPIDMDRLLDLTVRTEEEIEENLSNIRRVAGDSKLNPNSTLQLQKLLFGKLCLPVVDFTPKGAPSTAAASLQKLEKMHSIIPLIQKHRTLRKLYTASLLPWTEHAAHDGKLHPRYKPAFVKTGRLSSEMPNIQQVPRDKEVRSIFGGVPGYQVVELDYSQLELRIVAWLSGEYMMLDAYKKGADLHQVTADELGVDRQTGKTANFGLLYGAGYRKLRQIAESDYGVHMSELQAEAIRTKWFDAYPQVAEFHENVIEQARRDGGITTELGRWRPLPDLYSNDWAKKGGAERQAVNTPIQSVASDLTLSVLTDLVNADWLREKGIRPFITVHDSIVFLVPDEHMVMVENIAAYMENPPWREKFGIEIGVPLVVDIKSGYYWGETK